MLVPILMLLVLLVVQAALWFHTANIAQAGAARGAAAGAPVTSSVGAAADTAALTVRENGGRLIAAPVVAVDERSVAVTVSLRVPHVVPFFPAVVTRTQMEPRERFIPEDER